MKGIIASILLLFGCSVGFGWKYNEYRDKLTGEITERRVYMNSDEKFRGWLSSEYFTVYVTCDESVWAYTDAGFAYEWNSSGYLEQSTRVIFDDGEVESFTWVVFTKDIDYMNMYGDALDKRFIEKMLNSNSFRVEIEPFNGNKAVLEFDLTNFKNEWNKCSMEPIRNDPFWD